MKKVILLSTTIMIAPFMAGEAGAQCVATQDCASLGYTEASCPNGGLKCPFGSGWACIGSGSTEPEIPTCSSGQEYSSSYGVCVCNNANAMGRCLVGGFENTACTDTVYGTVYYDCKQPYYYLYSDLTYSLTEQTSKGEPIGIIMGMSDRGRLVETPSESDYIIALDFKKNLTKQEALDYCANYSQPGLEAGKWNVTGKGTELFLFYHDSLGTPEILLGDFAAETEVSSGSQTTLEWRKFHLNRETHFVSKYYNANITAKEHNAVCSIKLEDSGIFDKLQEI